MASRLIFRFFCGEYSDVNPAHDHRHVPGTTETQMDPGMDIATNDVIPENHKETVESFNSTEKRIFKDILYNVIQIHVSEESESELSLTFFPLAIYILEQIFLDEKYPPNILVAKYNLHTILIHFRKKIEKEKKESKTQDLFPGQVVLHFLFKLFNLLDIKREAFEPNFREELLPVIEKILLPFFTKHIHSFQGLEDIFSQQYLPKVIDILKEADVADFKQKNFNRVQAMNRFMGDYFIQNLDSQKGKIFSENLLSYTLACFEKMTIEKLNHIMYIFEKKVIDWQKHMDAAVELLKKFQGIPPYKEVRWEPDEKNERNADVDYMNAHGHPYRLYKDSLMVSMKSLCQNFNDLGILDTKEIQKGLVDLLLSCIQGYSRLHCALALSLIENINSWDESEALIPDILEAINKCLHVKNFRVFNDENQKKLYPKTLQSLCPYIKSKNPVIYSEIFYDIFTFCLEYNLIGDTKWKDSTLHAEIVTVILKGYIDKNQEALAIQPFAPHIMELIRKNLEFKLTIHAKSCLRWMVSTHKDIEINYISDIIDTFCSSGNVDLLGAIERALNGKTESEIVMEKLGDIIAVKLPVNSMPQLYKLLYLVSKKFPKRAMAYKDTFLHCIEYGIGGLNGVVMAMMGLTELSTYEPSKFSDEVDNLSNWAKNEPQVLSCVATFMATIAISSKDEAKKIMPMLIEHLKDSEPDQKLSVLSAIRTIAVNQQEVVLAYRVEIEKYRYTPGTTNLSGMIQDIINILEDRSLLTVSHKVDDVKEDVDQLEERVVNTEGEVKELENMVEHQQKDLNTVKEDVNEQGERLYNLEEVVDETIDKVEEIDNKTISSAPAWSRGVSLLLNPESDSDWRFIAIRLGYSPEDIRNWATAHDPTMSMLSEWYTTHKSSDATYAVLTSLKELGRNDCADIIEKALRDADQAVPGPPPEMTHPPPIFISYQWDHQPQVKAIRQHLEMAGFECWMDIGQMGGGDKLYEKIDEGMRGAKVVLSMCTAKYAESKNCNHEVNLASLLNKPIIPIILEDMSWPPPGAMSMLFSQLLYIDFKSGQKAKAGKKFWTDAKFFELLGQVTYYVAPNPDKITDEYKNWIPKVEEQTASHKNEKTNHIASVTKITPEQSSQEPEVSDPEVFISYQWDKQAEVKRLYGKLAELGFTCWLDINQMGGGDALYGKIDRGVRKAKVVVSCITPKYSLSANCRREVSLSDALRKPIIPILLEEMTWPPEGPMSMPFAQLLYIDFTREKSQEYINAKFKELLSKIRQYSQPQRSPSNKQPAVKSKACNIM